MSCSGPCKPSHPHWEEPRLSVKGRNQAVLLAQNGNAGKRGEVFEKRLRKKWKKTPVVRRNTKVKKNKTPKKGRGKQEGWCFLLHSKVKERVQQALSASSAVTDTRVRDGWTARARLKGSSMSFITVKTLASSLHAFIP